MEKMRNIIRKGLEKVVAPILIGAAALVGSSQEASAHTDKPTFYIKYAQTNQVDFADSNTLLSTSAIWKDNYAIDPFDVNTKSIFVGTFINTGTNSPVNSSSKMQSSDYSFYLDSISKSDWFTVWKGIAVTKGVWQGRTLSYETVDTTISDIYGEGTGYLENNHLGFLNSGDAVRGNALSSAIQIDINELMQAGDTLTFQMGYPTSVKYADGSKHIATNDEFTQVNFVNSGSIVMTPEPSPAVLFGLGCVALGAYTSRKRRKE